MSMNMPTVRHLISCLALLLLFMNSAMAQRIETEIDQEEVYRGGTITLTVRIFDRQGTVPIDIAPLREDFDIISTRSSSQLRTVNNRVQASTTYRLVLFPLRVGEQEIPAIEVGGQVTDPIAINVLSEPERASSDPEIRLETELSSDEIYVQEQLLFTVRLYYTLRGIRNPNFTEPDMDHAVVQMLGPPNQYEQLIDGERYGVYEMNYAIFPQRSGTLEIPDIVFRGQVTDGSSRYVFRNANVDPVTAFSEGYTVQVKERPASYPENRTWLPSAELRVEENWSGNLRTLEPGESLEREVRITAVGLDAAALPPLQAPEVDGINIYQEPAETERTIVDGNVVGVRTERFSYVAAEPGTATIPEVRIPWWNTTTGSLETAVLPSASISIMEPPGSGSPVPSPGISEAQIDQIDRQAQTGDELLSTAQTPQWILALLVGLLGIMALVLVWRFRQQQSRGVAVAAAQVPTSPAYARNIADDQEKQAFNDLESICKQGQADRVRLALIAWGRQYFRDEQMRTLDALADRCQDADISELCREVQAAMYGAHATGSDGNTLPGDLGERLLNRFRQLRASDRRQRRETARQAPFNLPPLYRDGS